MSAVNLVLEIALNILHFFPLLTPSNPTKKYCFALVFPSEDSELEGSWWPVIAVSQHDRIKWAFNSKGHDAPIAVPCWESLICPPSSTAHLWTPGPEPSDPDFTVCPLEQMSVVSDNYSCWGHDPTGKTTVSTKLLYRFFFSFNACSSSPWAFYSSYSLW